MTFNEVKPTLRFLGIFLGTYLTISTLYGLWIESLGTRPDPVTVEVSREVVGLLRIAGEPATFQVNPNGPTVWVMKENRKVLNVFEGCNGVNVLIVFLGFILAFGGAGKRQVVFLAAGFLIVHVSNLARIIWLYALSSYNEKLFYYFHKYLFTAAIYAVVFLLWWFWVTRWYKAPAAKDATH